jgi:hypothetical protein
VFFNFILLFNFFSYRYSGSAVTIDGVDSEIHDCEFVLCGNLYSSTDRGGSVYFYGNSIDIRGCSFFNSTGYNGGAIYIEYYSVVSILNTVFQYCSANNDGGAIFFRNSYSYQSRFYIVDIYIFYLFLGIWKMLVSLRMCMINFFFFDLYFM